MKPQLMEIVNDGPIVLFSWSLTTPDYLSHSHCIVSECCGQAVLAEQTAVHADKERHRWARVSSIPDTLYMVDGGVPRPHPHGPLGFGTAPLHDPPPLLTVVGNEIPGTDGSECCTKYTGAFHPAVYQC